MQTSQVHYYKPGRCQNIKTEETRCALTPDDCEPARNVDGEKWVNAIQMEVEGMEACNCETTMIRACMSGGTSMTYNCAPGHEEDYCRANTNIPNELQFYDFIPTNAAQTTCFCDGMRSQNDVLARIRTRYGACYVPASLQLNQKEQFFCAYSSDYCKGDHIWVHPDDVLEILGEEECHCENTRIGGCVGGFQDFHCAVTEFDCISNIFVPPIMLKSEYNHACLLCDETMTTQPKQDEINEVLFSTEKTEIFTTVPTIAIIISVLVIILSALAIMFTVCWKIQIRRRCKIEDMMMDEPKTLSADVEIS